MRSAICKHFLLKDDSLSGKSAKRREETDGKQDTMQRALNEMLRLGVNQQCHDCASPSTNWVSMISGCALSVASDMSVVTQDARARTRSAVLCDQCAAVHVQLPSAAATVRSIALAKWDETSVYAFRQV
jgi:hypothetical protein